VDGANEDKRAQVVRAAFAVFTEYGFSRAQVTAIAEASHVSTATIYKMFESKEALFKAAYDYGIDWLHGVELADPSIRDPLAALHHVARRYAEILNSPTARRIVRMQIAQNTTPAGDGRTQGFSMRAIVENGFADALAACARAGLLEVSSLSHAHALLTGFIEHQTLIYGLIIDEDRVADFSGTDLAEEAVRATLLAYAPAGAGTSVLARQDASAEV
jgi:AcrR family transcriptional regulator